MKQIGCIGLGKMGAGLCESVLRAGLALMVYDTRTAATVPFATRASCAESISALVATCDFILLSLPDAPAVENVIQAMLCTPTALQGKTIIDTSTSLPDTSRAMDALVSRYGAHFLDVPLAGTPDAARQGKLSVYVGGDEAAFQTAQEVIASFAINITFLGISGSGNIAKLVNNYLAIQYTQLYCEIFPLAKLAGMNLEVLFEAIGKTGVNCVPYRLYGEKIVSGRFPLAFSIDLALKDMRYAARMTKEQSVSFPFLHTGLTQLETAVQKGLGAQDLSVLCTLQNSTEEPQQ